MFRTTALTALVVALAAPVMAQSVNPGVAQMAAGLGVQPGAYSQAQLTRLEQAKMDNDAELIRFILSSPTGNTVSSANTSPTTPGAVQFALSLGVEPGVYSIDTLQRLSDAITENDATLIRAILNGDINTATNDDRGVVTPAKVQLAASVGVNPADYSTAELATLLTAQQNAGEE